MKFKSLLPASMRTVLLALAVAAVQTVGVESARSAASTATNQTGAHADMHPRRHGLRQKHAGAKHSYESADITSKADALQHLRTPVAASGHASTASSGEEDKDQSAAVAGLQRELAEVKQDRANVKELQQALAAQVALLRESAALQRASTSARGRAAATKQVQKSEQLVKDITGMLRESREAATEGARAVLREVPEVRSMLDTLNVEARQLLQTFVPTPSQESRVVQHLQESESTPHVASTLKHSQDTDAELDSDEPDSPDA